MSQIAIWIKAFCVGSAFDYPTGEECRKVSSNQNRFSFSCRFAIHSPRLTKLFQTIRVYYKNLYYGSYTSFKQSGLANSLVSVTWMWRIRSFFLFHGYGLFNQLVFSSTRLGTGQFHCLLNYSYHEIWIYISFNKNYYCSQILDKHDKRWMHSNKEVAFS